MKIALLVALCVLALANAAVVKHSVEDLQEWEDFKTKFERKYETDEEELKRKLIFMDNLKFIREHNKKFENKEETFAVRVNDFADLTNEEFRGMYNKYKPGLKKRSGQVYKRPANTTSSSSVDWRDQGAVTAIKNQGSCGSCWAFSTTGSIEGQHYISTGTLTSLSEQNLVDCSGSYGNEGCDGGLMDDAFEYVIKNGGIDTEASYAYTGEDGTCSYKSSKKGATISSYVDITEGSEDDLESAVESIGPISVAIDASPLSFQFYFYGVYKSIFCSASDLDHGVLVIGYGKKSGIWTWDGEYWLMKNSWGTSWGLEGYFMLAKNDNNMCGVASEASYPVV